MAKIRSLLVPTNASALKPRCEISRSSRIGWVSELSWRFSPFELRLPEELEFALLDRVLGQPGIGPHPRIALRVAVGGRPLAVLRVQRRAAAAAAAPTIAAPISSRFCFAFTGASRKTCVPLQPVPARVAPPDAEAIEHAVVRADVDAAVGDRQAAEVVERRDLVAARPQLLRRCARRARTASRAWSARCGSPRCCTPGRYRRRPARRPRRCRTRRRRRWRSRPGLGLIHVARQPGRRQLAPCRPACSSSLNAATAPLRHLAVLDRRLELRVLRPPERHQHPARAVRVFPRRQRAPGARPRRSDLFVADERRAVDRRAVVLAAERAGVEQPDAALLARLRRCTRGPCSRRSGPVTFMSRSRLRSQKALVGANQSFISIALVVGFCFAAMMAWP